MFERRLKILLIILAVPTLVLIFRLVQLQIIDGHIYQAHAEQLLYQPPRFFPFVRGAITDCKGIRLAYDAPAWEICVDYGVLVEDEDYLDKLEENWPDSQELIEEKIKESWQVIAELTNISKAALKLRCDRIVNRIRRWKEVVSERHGREIKIAEERVNLSHAVVEGLNQEQMAKARECLAVYPWVEVLPSYVRKYSGGEAVGHLPGKLGEVSRDDIDKDSNADDPLACYTLGDLRGESGIEALGEHWLRGRRGLEYFDKEGRPICELADKEGRPICGAVEPQAGQTFRLTIDLELQQQIYERLMQTVEDNSPASGGTVTGGSAVLLDIPTRQILALVSCPSFDPDATKEEWQIIQQDKVHCPHKFRAVREHYPPGSTVKPMILASALDEGRVRPNERITCHKYLFPAFQDRWRCFGYHYEVDPITAIQKSCNIFFYNVGERMRVPRLASWLSQFGLGRPSGIGLIEGGFVPVEGSRGNARQIAIGQWDFRVTPLQAANMIATVASGEYRPVTIWADDPKPRTANRLSISQQYWRIVREGMYKVVNEPGGTAFGRERADFDDHPVYVLLGKTGSAEAPPHEQAHAWFVGYLAERSHYLDDANHSDMNVALALIIEYGGHGGEVAAPVAGDMVRTIMAHRQGGNEKSMAAGGRQ
ncbi:MAG: hypothetical protein JSV03_02410 [Planctomycetota bacterium]|nr:MAG: hypothetical protein JSV03_02410 [Planctomycetota bacterium]